MKGAVIRCLQEVVVNLGDKDKWENVLEKSDSPYKYFNTLADVDEELTMNLIKNSALVLNLSIQGISEALGKHWVTIYAPRVYPSIYNRFRNIKEFILGLDEVHVELTHTIKNAKPPRFTYIQENENEIIMIYKSDRGLIDLVVGMALGAGLYFKEKIRVLKRDEKKVSIHFDEIKITDL